MGSSDRPTQVYNYQRSLHLQAAIRAFQASPRSAPKQGSSLSTCICSSPHLGFQPHRSQRAPRFLRRVSLARAVPSAHALPESCQASALPGGQSSRRPPRPDPFLLCTVPPPPIIAQNAPLTGTGEKGTRGEAGRATAAPRGPPGH